MTVEQLRAMNQQELFDFMIQQDIGNVVKSLGIYWTPGGSMLSVDQWQETGDVTVSKFEVLNPVRMLDDLYEDFDIHSTKFTLGKAIQTHEHLVSAYSVMLVFYDMILIV